MGKQISNYVKAAAKKIIGALGLEVRRCNRYLPASATIKAAKREGLPVGDYVERLWGKQGDTQRVIDQLDFLDGFRGRGANVLEIGAGTGRYLEKVLSRTNPAIYESYETAGDWADWLQKTYHVVSRKGDGISLRETPGNFVDFAHAHGVFVYVPFLVSYSYWKEIWRVTRKGGFVAFDIISEKCLSDNEVGRWLLSRENYPTLLPKDYVTELFKKEGFVLHRNFFQAYGAGKSEYLVFRREQVEA